MASLSDQIDRLSRSTRAIRATTAHPTAVVSGPFTRAVLDTSLGDLIRDVDPSELGLFSLPESEITRAEFTGATPLKRAPSRRDDAPKSKDIDPEVYAHAALKCIDRYNGVRPMPRAHAQVTVILERLHFVRENIQSLTETLQQVQAVEGPSLKFLVHEEEDRVRDLQARLRVLQERKKNATTLKSAARKPNTVIHPTRAPPPPSSPQEESFWNTPAATAKTLRFTDNIMETTDSLLNEQVDLGDISTISSTSPIPASWTAKEFLPILQQDDTLQINPSDPNSSSEEYPNTQNDNVDNGDEVEECEDENTVIITKPIANISPPPTSSTQGLAPTTPSDTLRVKHSKLKANSEVERIVTRIWTTIGDMIMPGHLSQGGGGSKFPQAKETLYVVDPMPVSSVHPSSPYDSAHLQSLSVMCPSPTSPSVSSVSSISVGAPVTPTSQQILTAHLLVSLLSSPPQFSLPLNKIKDSLATKASSGGGAGATGTTRILYGCVAKRLLKIDRSGGKQIVKFDV